VGGLWHALCLGRRYLRLPLASATTAAAAPAAAAAGALNSRTLAHAVALVFGSSVLAAREVFVVSLVHQVLPAREGRDGLPCLRQDASPETCGAIGFAPAAPDDQGASTPGGGGGGGGGGDGLDSLGPLRSASGPASALHGAAFCCACATSAGAELGPRARALEPPQAHPSGGSGTMPALALQCLRKLLRTLMSEGAHLGASAPSLSKLHVLVRPPAPAVAASADAAAAAPVSAATAILPAALEPWPSHPAPPALWDFRLTDVS
jgi:hypothetical protein